MNGRKASYVNKFRRSFLSPFVLSHEKGDQNEKKAQSGWNSWSDDGAARGAVVEMVF